MTVPYLPSGGSTQAEMQPHSSVAARATGKVGRKSWRSFCSGSRYAGSGKQRRSMRGGLLFISALPQSTHTITSPRPRPIKVLLTTNMLPRCQGLTVANGVAIERLDHSDAGIPMKPGSLDSQHYRGCFFCWVLGSFRAALSFITRDPRAYPVLVRTRRLLRLHSWAAFLLIGGPNTVERDTPANSLQRRRFKGEGRTRRSALVARNPGDWYPPDSTRVNNPFQERRHWAKHRRSPLLWCQLLGPGPQSSFRFRVGPHLLSFRFGSCRRVFHGFFCRICGWFLSGLRRRQRS